MKLLAKLSKNLVRFTHNASALLLAIAFVLIFYQVITRFVFGDAAVWSEIIARSIIIWSVFLVLGAAIYLDKMIPIDAIKNFSPPYIRVWFIRIAITATILFLIILIWFGFKITIHVFTQQVAMIEISASWFYLAIPIGAVLAIPGVFLKIIEF